MGKGNFLRNSVRTKLFLTFALILIVPSLLIGLISYQSAKQGLEEMLMQSSKQNVALLNQTITQFIDPEKKDVEYLASQIDRQTWEDESGVLERLARFHSLHPEINNVYVGTETGRMLLTPKQELPADYDPRKRPWYELAMKNSGQVIITAPYPSDSEAGGMDVTVAKALADGSGVMAVDLNLSAISNIAGKTKIGREGYSFILDAEQNFIIHPHIEAGTKGTELSYVPRLYEKDSDSFDYLHDGIEQHLDYTTNSSTGWKIAGTLHKDEVEALAQPILTRTLMVIVGAVVLSWVLVSVIVRRLTRPLQALNQASAKISDGDLSQHVSVNSRDEIGQLSAGFNSMVDSLRSVVRQVSDTSGLLAASASQLTSSADQSRQASEHTAVVMSELAEGTDKQAQTIEQTVQTVTELSAGIEEISATAQDVSETAAQAADVAETGSAAILKAVEQMESISSSVNHSAATIKELGAHAQHIGQIVVTITGISEQTNLLAINAAIEAARAGEHGKGFAVVADEVRKLAEQSAQSANQITDYIATIQAGITGAVNAMESGTREVGVGLGVVQEAGASFRDIQTAVSEVANRIGEVTLAVQEMTVGAEQVAQSIESIAEVASSAAGGAQNVSAATEEQLASIEEISNSAAALAELADELSRIIHRFKV